MAIRQKSAKYLRISWTYLDLLYRFDRRISGEDFPNIRLQSPKGRCYGNQLICEILRHSTTDWPIVNLLSIRSMAIIRLHRVQIRWSSFCPVISQFTQFLPHFAHNLTTIFIRHGGISKRIGRSQFSFQHSNQQSLLYFFPRPIYFVALPFGNGL